MKELILIAIFFSAIGLGIYLKTNFPVISNFGASNNQSPGVFDDVSSTMSENNNISGDNNDYSNSSSRRKEKKSQRDLQEDFQRESQQNFSGQDEQKISVINGSPEISASATIPQQQLQLQPRILSSQVSSIVSSSSISVPALTSIPTLDSSLGATRTHFASQNYRGNDNKIVMDSSVVPIQILDSTVTTTEGVAPIMAPTIEASPIEVSSSALLPPVSSLIVSTSQITASASPIIPQIQIPTSSLTLAPIPNTTPILNLASASTTLNKKIQKIHRKKSVLKLSSISSSTLLSQTICNCPIAPIALAPASTASTSAQAPVAAQTLNSGKIIIAEIMIGKKGNSGCEFIKLYNLTPNIIDLTGWSIKKKGSILVSKKHFQNKKILPGQYFLLAKSGGYDSSALADILWPKSYSLSRASETIILYDAAKNRIQEISWEKFPKDKVMKRVPLNSDKFVFENP